MDPPRSSYTRSDTKPASSLPPASSVPDSFIPTAPLSTPIPQDQWSSVPSIFHPPNWGPDAGRDKPLPMPPTSSSMMSPTTETLAQRRLQRTESLYSPREAPSPLRPSALRPDPNMLYPQMSPYDFAETARSAPPIRQHFSESLLATTPVDSRLSSSLPRSPTYPGTSSKSKRPVSAGNDNALEDEEEYRLFIEATTGIGPIPTFRQNSIVEDNWFGATAQPRSESSSQKTQPPKISTIPESAGIVAQNDASRYASAVSPVSDVPMSYLAYPRYPGSPARPSTSQSPGAPAISPLSGSTITTVNVDLSGRNLGGFEGTMARSGLPRQLEIGQQTAPVDLSRSGLGIYGTPQPRSNLPQQLETGQQVAVRRENESWLTANDPPEPDEELPTYASSQAQAHQSQRAEGVRRAQELQRRWREGGRKYGPDM